MNKYDINYELKLYSKFKPKFNKIVINNFNKLLKTPAFLKKDKELDVESIHLKNNDHKFEVLIISTKNIKNNAPCLIFIHGGAFIIEAVEHHYKQAVIYAKILNIKVIFIKYTLAVGEKILAPLDDCYFTLNWILTNLENLNIDKNKIGFIGDSAGGNIIASLYLKIKKEKLDFKPKFLMLLYPYLDYTFSSESNKKYIDTPMWNSSMTQNLFKVYNFNNINEDEHIYISPILNKNYKGYPPTYIESCEFDPLHDDAHSYYEILKNHKVDVTLNETKRTYHAYDIVLNSTVAYINIYKRIEFIKKHFKN